MLVVLALAAIAVLAGVVVVATGQGGELAEFAPDVPPLDLPEAVQLGAADFMALQLPVSIVGYHTQSVDEALNRVVNALSERDTRIAVLEQRVAELLASRLQARHELHAGPLSLPRTEHAPQEPEERQELLETPSEPFDDRSDDRSDDRPEDRSEALEEPQEEKPEEAQEKPEEEQEKKQEEQEKKEKSR
ncbi:hypothetical protein [Streptosporangium carneum]|uniref:hypothetical protein n=1 Tax=Streptosporangium carneum TaxID=47481 RepID=UPI0022F2DEB4|nr:hypothetical protein [Streptosporangium carneum]